jgi:hypothetical protein
VPAGYSVAIDVEPDGRRIVGLSSLPGSSLTHAAMWTLRLSGAG